MARIKIVGYIETDALNPDYVDLEDSTGLTAEGYTELHRELLLDDVEITLEDSRG